MQHALRKTDVILSLIITIYFTTLLTVTFWRRIYFFFLILAHPVYKMLIREPNTLELWNKLNFEEKKTESIYRV